MRIGKGLIALTLFILSGCTHDDREYIREHLARAEGEGKTRLAITSPNPNEVIIPRQ
jgi:hypothetical protein